MKFARSLHCLRVSLLFFTLAAVGCQGDSSDPDQASTTAQDSELTLSAPSIVADESPNEQQQQAMLKAKEALFQKLSGRLMEAMGTEGPAAAIAVCHKEAFDLAKEVGESEGLQIGRTGVRLRNPKNQPPGWARPLVEDRVDTPTFVRLTNGHSAALLPIKLQSQCLMCHGAKDQIAPVIQEQLAQLYPEDQATGFAEGELRGWFWIEKP